MNRLLSWMSSPSKKPEHTEKFYPKGSKSDFCTFPNFSTLTGTTDVDLGYCGYTRWSFSMRKEASEMVVQLKCQPANSWLLAHEYWKVVADVRVRLVHQINKEKSIKEESNIKIFDKDRFWRKTFDIDGFVHDDSVAFQVFIGIVSADCIYSGDFFDFSTNIEETDVILKANDIKFHVTKQILSVQSPVFRAMFTGNFADNYKEEVEIQEVDLNSFHMFLQYLYMAPIKVSKENVCDLLEMADRFMVKRAMRDCEIFLISGDLEEEKVIEISIFYNMDRVLIEIMRKKMITELENLFIESHESLPATAKMFYLERVHNSSSSSV